MRTQPRRSYAPPRWFLENEVIIAINPDDADDEKYGDFHGKRVVVQEDGFINYRRKKIDTSRYYFVPLKANRLMDAQHWQRCAFTGIPLYDHTLDDSLVVSTPPPAHRPPRPPPPSSV